MAKRITEETIKKMVGLRKRGFSLPEIHREVEVGYGTVFRYIKNVPIEPKYLKNWAGKRGGSRKRKLLLLNKAKLEAERLIRGVDKREATLILASLYWGEGRKIAFDLLNSDPMMIRLIVNILRKYFQVSTDRLRVSIRTFSDLDKGECLSFWSSITGVLKEKFVRVDVLEGKKKGKLKYGMCRIRVAKGGNLVKYIQAIQNRVAELA